MADTYVIVQQTQTVDLLGGTRVRDVMEIGATTLRHGVYFQVRIPIALWKAGTARPTVTSLADTIDTLLDVTQIVGVAYVQDVDPAGLLIDTYEIIVASASGDSTAVLRVPQTQMNVPGVLEKVRPLYEQLNATEAA